MDVLMFLGLESLGFFEILIRIFEVFLESSFGIFLYGYRHYGILGLIGGLVIAYGLSQYTDKKYSEALGSLWVMAGAYLTGHNIAAGICGICLIYELIKANRSQSTD